MKAHVIPAIPFSSLFPRSAQVQPQVPAAPLILPNPTVDRLVAHHPLTFTLSPPNDLLWAETFPKHGLNRCKFRRPMPPVPAGATCSSARLFHRVCGSIVTIMHGLISLHLTIQRATMPPKMTRHLCQPHTLPPHRGNLIPLLGA
jgi:hypothetical protein